MYPPNGRKGAQRLAELFPANRRTSVRPRPRLPATIVRNQPSACTGLRPKALVAQSPDSRERGRTLAGRNHAAAEDGRQTWAASAPTVCGGYGLPMETGARRRLGARSRRAASPVGSRGVSRIDTRFR